MNPLPKICPARSRFPRPRAMAASGLPPAPTIAEKEDISTMTALVTPIPAKASVPMPGM